MAYKRGFIPYALAALLIGLVGGFSTVLGPAFVQDIGISYNNTTWTALAQAMSTAACAPILGKVGDVIGRRKTLLLGIAVFTLGNVLSAFANSLVFMMIARFIVGVGTAAMGPVILAYIATEFPQDKIAKGFSLYMLLSSASVIIGPTIGGLIVSSYGWRTMLWVCVAICAAVFAGCVLTSCNQVSTKKALQNFDISGAVLILIFFSLLLCVPSFGQNFGWTSTPFLIVLILAIVSLVGLALAERKSSHPILSGSFMGRNAGRNNQNFIHTDFIGCRFRKPHMADMRRIESASENTDFYWNLSLFNVNLCVHQPCGCNKKTCCTDYVENRACNAEAQTQWVCHC